MSERDLHEWTVERLSDYVDDALPGSERETVGRHLMVCPECRAVREDLERVAKAARGLGPIEPPNDLWPAIRSRMVAGSGTGDDARVSAGLITPASARVAPWPWLAAAAVVLIALSASLAWWGRGAVGDAPPMAGTSPSTASTPVRAVDAGPDGPVSDALANELERLESVMVEGRARLAPGTIAVLERNLVLIERAIEDSYRALALDPENDFVRDHLERTYDRKLEYLREVARIVERAG